MSGFKEYGQYDALGLADLVRRREVSPAELVEEAIGRIEAINPRLNAVIHRMYDHARELTAETLPDGPFTGVPFLVKDLLAWYAGQPCRGGSRSLREFVPDHDSELVSRFKAAGVVTVGKTNTSEFGLMPFTEPELFGPSHNPWNPALTPSGSSGGSAVAVAARMVPMASGGDGGGSIRTPASACGVFGLKPSRGRNPVGPDHGELWRGAVAEHVLTRSVRDSAAMLDATAGPDVGAPYHAPLPGRPFAAEIDAEPRSLRIAFTSKSLLGNHVDRECVKGVEATAALLEELGHQVTEALPAIDRHAFTRAYFTMVCGEFAADIRDIGRLRGRKVAASELELGTRVVQILGESTNAAVYNQACRYLSQESRRIQGFFEDHDVLLTPTLSHPPPATGAAQPSRIEAAVLRSLSTLEAGGLMRALGIVQTVAARTFEFLAYTPVFNVTGQPACSIPLHWSEDGVPVGMHFVARYGDEATLFGLAGQLERARPWADRKPAVCAD